MTKDMAAVAERVHQAVPESRSWFNDHTTYFSLPRGTARVDVFVTRSMTYPYIDARSIRRREERRLLRAVLDAIDEQFT